MERPLTQLARAIEALNPALTVYVLEDGQRIIVSTKDSSDKLVDVTLRHNEDTDELIYWITETARCYRLGLPIRTLNEIVADAVEEATDPDRADRNLFPRPALEPRTLVGLPPEIAEDHRRRIIYRLMLQGHHGPRLRFALSETLADEFIGKVVDDDIRAIARELLRTITLEKEIRTTLLEQRLDGMMMALWREGRKDTAVRVMKILIDLIKLNAPNGLDESASGWEEWTHDEIRRYITTREVPQGKIVPRVH